MVPRANLSFLSFLSFQREREDLLPVQGKQWDVGREYAHRGQHEAIQCLSREVGAIFSGLRERSGKTKKDIRRKGRERDPITH